MNEVTLPDLIAKTTVLPGWVVLTTTIDNGVDWESSSAPQNVGRVLKTGKLQTEELKGMIALGDQCTVNYDQHHAIPSMIGDTKVVSIHELYIISFTPIIKQ